jgi:hypothetical protein
MSSEDNLLARELGKVGAQGGALGGKHSDVPFADKAGGAGGYEGARLAARFLPTEHFQKILDLRSGLQATLARVHEILASQGRIVDSTELQRSPRPSLSAVVKSGFFNMNPTIVLAEVIAATPDSCTLLLTGAAKEGLIKQHSAKKAVERLAAALQI